MFMMKSFVECAAGFVHTKRNIRGHGYQEGRRKFVDASLSAECNFTTYTLVRASVRRLVNTCIYRRYDQLIL